MPVYVASRRKKPATLEAEFPGATFVDVTSKGPQPWVRFSPFYPHGGVPIPATPGQFAQSVEGLWQGLKVFEKEGVDPAKWAVTSMKNLKRAGKRRGAVLGHRYGPAGEELLDYRAARERIYLPAYRFVLATYLRAELARLRDLSAAGAVVLLDYETNADVADLSRPLSHASLVKAAVDQQD